MAHDSPFPAEFASLCRLREAAMKQGNYDLAISVGWSLLRMQAETIDRLWPQYADR